MAVLPSFKDMSYYKLATIQYEAFLELKKSHERLKAGVIALFLILVAVGVGSYMGYSQFKNDIQPKIDAQYSVEESYPVPVEQLKEV